VVDSFAYIANYGWGLRIINVADPRNPHEVGYCSTPGRACDVAVAGGYAYVADWNRGLRVIDVGDPRSPHEVGYCVAPYWVYDVAVTDGLAYVTGDGLRVVDVSNPENPTEVGYYDTPYLALGIGATGNLGYVADGPSGLQIIEFCGGGVEETSGANMQPLTRMPTIARSILMLPEMVGAGRAVTTARLLNSAGRSVLDLAPGPNVVANLAPGVYFIRGAADVSKIMIWR